MDKFPKRFVVVADVLGFKNFIYSNSLSKVAKEYETLTIVGKLGLANVESVYSLFGTSDLVDCAVFSDTIFLWSRPVDKNLPEWISGFFYALNDMLRMSIQFELPLRMGIAFGEVHIDQQKGIYVGKPIVKAYEMEQRQNWIGGACDSSCMLEDPLRYKVYFEDKDEVINYPIPTKTKPFYGTALNWPRKEGELIHHIKKMSLKAKDIPSVMSKYEETLNFYKYIRS